MNRTEAIQLVVHKLATAVGARTMTIVGHPGGEVYEDCFLNLYNQEHNAAFVDDDLVLELWFANYKIAGVPATAILDTRIKDHCEGKTTMVKVRVKVDLDRIYVGGQRIYLDE